MTYRNFFYFYCFVLFLTHTACRTEKAKTEIQLSGFNRVLLLDSLSASRTIVKDDLEHFFDNITPVDMMIQMHKDYPLSTNRDSIVADYKKYIQTDVLDFSREEADYIAKTMAEAFELCQKAQFQHFPEEIKLIKTHGKHYGEDTYFTRENAIVIPKQALQKKDDDIFLKVILHEISHIVTRLNPTLKTELYAAIGFQKLSLPLLMNDSLRQRLLTNPDGHELTWATQLTTADGKNVQAIPLIYANETGYKQNKKEFFEYLGFNYFEIDSTSDGKSLNVQTIGNQQKSTLNTEGVNDLFHQKLNTDYIIHPDEIVADNFSILMFSMKNAKSLEEYTEGGRQLLDTVKSVLSK